MIFSTREAIEYLINLINTNTEKIPLIIAIDGRAAAGKTTFAKRLSAETGVPILHTDDFCRPRNRFGELKVSEFDGNFDVRRFKDEAVYGMLSMSDFAIGIFDCSIGEISTRLCYPASKCYIVEGAYSLNPLLGDYASVKVFLDVSEDIQRERIIKRNGAKAFDMFASVWIPAEERYIAHYEIKENCDIIIA